MIATVNVGNEKRSAAFARLMDQADKVVEPR
jgi:hypothetical protein